jgi:hypothetical protein
MTAGFFVRRHCEEHLRRSNPVLPLELLLRSFRSSFSHRKICAKEVDERYHDGYGKQYVALRLDHAEDGGREKIKIQASYPSRFFDHNEPVAALRATRESCECVLLTA